MKTLEQEWQEFRYTVIGPNAPEIQVAEMKKAFYSGAVMTLFKMRDEVAIEDEETAVALLEALIQEGVEFINGLWNGKV